MKLKEFAILFLKGSVIPTIILVLVVIFATQCFARQLNSIDPNKRCGKQYQEVTFSIIAVKSDIEDYNKQQFSQYPDLFKTHVIQACPNMRYIPYNKVKEGELDFLYFLDLSPYTQTIIPGTQYYEWNFTVYGPEEVKYIFGK